MRVHIRALALACAALLAPAPAAAAGAAAPEPRGDEAAGNAGSPEDEDEAAEASTGAPGQERAEDDEAGEEPASWDVPWLGGIRFVPQAQYRIRYRHEEGHDFTEGRVSDTLRHRARVGLSAMWADRVGALFQIQDVRTFGEESSPLGDYSAGGLDVHQAYASLLPLAEVELRLGRQEIAFENERLLGAADWNEPGRSFDALRARYEARGLWVDAFYAKLREGAAGLGLAPGSSVAGDQHLMGALVHYEIMAELSSGIMALGERDQVTGKRLYSVGAVLAGDVGKKLFHYSAEGYYQFGKAYGDISHSAFLAAATARVTLPLAADPYLEAHADMLSGDADPGDRLDRTFEVSLATNHKFFGEMDFFTDMERDTGERGLRDVGGALGASPVDGLDLRAAYHFFQAMASRPDELTDFGHELDIKAAYRFWEHASVAALYGVFFPGDIKKAGVPDVRPEHFVYATLDVVF
ncbi:MAG: alginate export family protein [Deltaproteobacteria bacterium]|nr:alginate export family protein [Deltaproteobacteria bacterium]